MIDRYLSIAVAAGALVLTAMMPQQASALPRVGVDTQAAPALVQQAGTRYYRRYDRPYYGGYERRYYRPRYYRPRYERPRYYGGGRSAHVRWCSNRYRTYDPYTNRYHAGGGVYRMCYSPYR